MCLIFKVELHFHEVSHPDLLHVVDYEFVIVQRIALRIRYTCISYLTTGHQNSIAPTTQGTIQ